MSIYHSGFSGSIEAFVNSRKMAGAWNEPVFGLNIKLFDHYCADLYPGEILRQEMVDTWCAKRETENVNSCYTRTLVIRLFIEYLHKHGKTDVLPPPVLKQDKKRRIPHAFSRDELERFFHECDSIIPCRGRMAYASELRKITCPVFFRLLYSSGIRTTEARFLMRDGVDLVNGVLDIQKSKGYDQHYVALHQSMTEMLSLMISAIITLLQISMHGKMTHSDLTTASITWQGRWATVAQNPRCIIILLSQGWRT